MTKLFPVIRVAFGIDSPASEPTAEECEELVAFGKKQSVLPVIYAGLKKIERPPALLKAMDRERNRDLSRKLTSSFS